jgi:Tfp pilus assembly protein PilF
LLRKQLKSRTFSTGGIVEALDAETAALGPDHVEHAPTLTNLGVLLLREGRAGEAEPLLRQAAKIRQAALPPTDGRVLRTRLALAQSDITGSEEAQSQVRALLDAALATDVAPQARALVLAEAAAWYRSRGATDEAERLEALANVAPAP